MAYCIQNNTVLDNLDFEVYEQYSPVFEKDVYEAISLENCVSKRVSQGGTSVASVDTQIQAMNAWLESKKS